MASEASFRYYTCYLYGWWIKPAWSCPASTYNIQEDQSLLSLNEVGNCESCTDYQERRSLKSHRIN